MEWISDEEFAGRWGISIQRVRDMCNPNKDPHYCPDSILEGDYVKLGKGFRIFWNLSLVQADMRPRVRQRDKKTRRGNPNLSKKKPLDVLQEA